MFGRSLVITALIVAITTCRAVHTGWTAATGSIGMSRRARYAVTAVSTSTRPQQQYPEPGKYRRAAVPQPSAADLHQLTFVQEGEKIRGMLVLKSSSQMYPSSEETQYINGKLRSVLKRPTEYQVCFYSTIMSSGWLKQHAWARLPCIMWKLPARWVALCSLHSQQLKVRCVYQTCQGIEIRNM